LFCRSAARRTRSPTVRTAVDAAKKPTSSIAADWLILTAAELEAVLLAAGVPLSRARYAVVLVVLLGLADARLPLLLVPDPAALGEGVVRNSLALGNPGDADDKPGDERP
jgi:hypothetical protein